MDTVQFFTEDVENPISDNEANAIKYWLFLVTRSEGFTIESINYIFCSDEYMLQINRQYLQHDYYTDIITFDNSEPDSDLIEADIFVSLERVKDNANKLNSEFSLELKRVLVHGVLHLCGYGDKEDQEAKLMRDKEDHYLSLYMN
jgi:rRNA maturation RNase YbeY